MTNKHHNENKCDGWCKLRDGIDCVEFNHDSFGNGIFYYSNVRYRMVLNRNRYYGGPYARVYVKNAGGGLYFEGEEFDEWFEIVRIDKDFPNTISH